ncbi:cytochrome bd ubiquinol oxidase subunit I [Methylocella silvestris BL2]|uniref:Cytochrome bd ubiquinol oxidase subunit I n=1 Tax=Methylocella silvestris (strain DSM 15510 / CIP 108128 / LMG 27833 / NCIMB 13906 / BL2) TaxID=395965 RepID=B8ESY6_METSB|nr:cytochrome ubiquinol oxidase subunit I [Methylocella silvestris]ACK51124.1 cytochrome bd ubiquinol oxidase subunit I [Methylocella silvestris BL2]
MDITALLLSRIQFAVTISFHIIFPAFTVGLAAWLCVLEARWLVTGRPVYRRLFDFWRGIFAVAFGMGVVSGIVMAFQFGTNWSELSRRTGAIQGPLLLYESFTAFALEASFFGVLMFGRERVPKWFFFFSCAMVALGTTLSSFWIMVNNSWMQWPVGYQELPSGVFEPTSWFDIIFSSVVWVRFPHMLLAAYITSSFCIAATGAWHLLRGAFKAEAEIMLRMSLGLAAVLVPAQMLVGHLVGDYTHDKQPAKFAAIEARWNDEQPASEVLIAWPNEKTESNDYAISIPYLGSLIGSMSLTAKEVGLKSSPPEDRPPVLIPFFAFRVMVGCGLLMLALAWYGSLQIVRRRIEGQRGLLIAIFLSFPIGFIATLTGWFTAEVGRQPWTVYGLLRTADAATPFLTAPEVAATLAIFSVVYSVIFAAGAAFILRLLRRGPVSRPMPEPGESNPKRPLSIPIDRPSLIPRADRPTEG